MDSNAQDAARYRALSAWMRDGQPAQADNRMAGEMLGLVQRRRAWPIPQAAFDAAVDRAMLPKAELRDRPQADGPA
jgi:hypothetical protein